MELTGPAGTTIGIVFFLLWIHATYCVVMVALNCRDGFWMSFFRYGTFWPAKALTSAGLAYRRRFYWTVLAAFVLYGVARLTL